MNFDTVKRTWKSEQNAAILLRDPGEIAREVQRKYRRERRYWVWVNFQEGIPALFLSWLIFARGLRIEVVPWTHFVAATMILGFGFLFVGFNLRQLLHERQFGDSMRETIRRSMSQVDHSIWLVRNMVWWGFLPLCSAAGLLVYQDVIANDKPIWVRVSSTAIALSIAYGIYLWNQRKLNRKYLPRRKQLEELLRQSDNDGRMA